MITSLLCNKMKDVYFNLKSIEILFDVMHLKNSYPVRSNRTVH